MEFCPEQETIEVGQPGRCWAKSGQWKRYDASPYLRQDWLMLLDQPILLLRSRLLGQEHRAFQSECALYDFEKLARPIRL